MGNVRDILVLEVNISNDTLVIETGMAIVYVTESLYENGYSGVSGVTWITKTEGILLIHSVNCAVISGRAINLDINFSKVSNLIKRKSVISILRRVADGNLESINNNTLVLI